MQVTGRIHSLEIPFKIAVAPGKTIDRTVFVFLVLGEKITLIDTGVSGSESRIFDYIRKIGRDPKEISTLILSHSHPDHLGAARSIHEATGCEILAHKGEKEWIENTSRQFRERPVPGFDSLVQGPVHIDGFLADGETLSFQKDTTARVIHTPGHSRGSISLLFGGEQKVVLTGDAVLLANDLPMYDDISDSVDSLGKLAKLDKTEFMLSSFETMIQGHYRMMERIDESVCYFQRIHETVLEMDKKTGKNDPIELCQQVVTELKLPPYCVNPITARAFVSSLAHKNLIFKR